MEPKITTLAEILACPPNEYGWRTLPDGRRVRLGDGVMLGDGVRLGNYVTLGAEKSEIPVRVLDLKHALAALSPAPAKACSGFVCDLVGCSGEAVGYHGGARWEWHPCRACGQPYSAHQQEQAGITHAFQVGIDKLREVEQAQQPARKLPPCDHDNCGPSKCQQPAPAALPTMIDSIEANFLWVRKSVFEAYQRECERLRGETACDACCGTGMALSGPCGCGGTRKLRDMVTHLRQLLYTTEQRAEQLQQHRDAAADAEFAATQRAEQAENLRDMMVEKCSHAGIVRERLEDKLEQAERERDEARGENGKLALRLDEVAGIALRVKDELAEAQAELAALKAQEPVAQWKAGSERAFALVFENQRARLKHDTMLYAAPVPPPEPSLLTLVAECLRKVDEAIDGDRAETIRELALRLKRCVDGFTPLTQHEAALKSLSDAMSRTHEAALAQARAEERERCDKAITNEAVRVDLATQHLDAASKGGITATARVAALYAARDLVRALGGEAGE